MFNRIIVLASIMVVFASVAVADIPAFPGAKPFGATQAAQPGANVKIDMPGMPGMGTVNAKAKSHTYSLPAATAFEEIKKFYNTELTKLGYAEKANINVGGMGAPMQTASFSSKDGMNTVTITLTQNAMNTTENLLSVSESSTSLH